MQRKALATRRQGSTQRRDIDVEEIEFFRIRKILAQDAVGRLRTGTERYQGIRVGEADGRHGDGGQGHPLRRVDGHKSADCMHEQGIAQGGGKRSFTIDENAQ
ncbi:hypothetical protein D3C81_1318820 [compost metagenome]